MYVIIAVFLFASCSYEKPVLETEYEQISIPINTFHEPSSSNTPALTLDIALTKAPSPTPFERTDVMNSPKIVIKKSERMLYVYDEDKLCAKFKIALGFAPEGHKMREGDGKTPEGTYYICTKNDKSKYYLALAISYPNTDDAKSGLERGIISEDEYGKIEKAISEGSRPPWDTALGGEIMIHGSDVSSDWTAAV